MGIEGLFAKKMLEDTKTLKNQFAKEREDVKTSELENIDFFVAYSKLVSNMNIGAVVLIILFSFRILAKPVLKHFLYHEPFDMEESSVIVLVLLGALLIFALVYFVIVFTKRKIHVKKSTVYCGKKSWHYLDISKIVVNKMNIANIYVNEKKVFWISPEFDNFESLLSWAEKCHIPVERKVDIVTKELPTELNGNIKIPTKYAILIIVIAFVVFFVFIPLMVFMNVQKCL